jgi:hypothetical protein
MMLLLLVLLGWLPYNLKLIYIFLAMEGSSSHCNSARLDSTLTK